MREEKERKRDCVSERKELLHGEEVKDIGRYVGRYIGRYVDR